MRAAWEAERQRRLEEEAEEKAPRQQRVPVIGADGRVLREPLAEHDEKRGGYRRADTLRRMHNGNPNLVTKIHLRAAERFRDDYEVGHYGLRRRSLYEHVDRTTPTGLAEARLDALRRYRSACDALGGSLRTPVQMIAIHGRSLQEVAKILGITSVAASGYIVAGLDVLSDFYWPERRRRIVNEPPLVVDLSVTDVPQERLGRVRKSA